MADDGPAIVSKFTDVAVSEANIFREDVHGLASVSAANALRLATVAAR